MTARTTPTKVVLLDGPYAGRELTAADLPSNYTPHMALVDCAGFGWRWEVAWPPKGEADDEEVTRWVRADIVGRVFRAAVDGRAVRFGGQRWVLPHPSSGETFLRAADELEAVIAAAGRHVGVLTDGEEGDLVIGMAGPEAE